MAREIARQLGREHLLKIGNGARGEEVVRVGDAYKARRLLDFKAKTPLPEGVARTVAYYRSLLGLSTSIAGGRSSPPQTITNNAPITRSFG